jgi:pimeloyl-ACP methyl ester carboxylesterase
MKPFRVSISEETLHDLSNRLARTRWTDEVEGAGWDYGTNLGYLKELMKYWQAGFDWRKQEETINKFANFRAEVDGVGIHFIHERGKGKNPLPIVLLHGWPSSFLQMQKIIPLLTDPASQGGSEADSFDVVVVSLPGYGFSDRSTQKGMTVARMADLVEKLMTETLGYERFAVRGSDMGAWVGGELALSYPESVIGFHRSGSAPYFGQQFPDLTEAEKKFIAESTGYQMAEGAYAALQITKPQTLAYGLNDSPAGLAAWIVEKFRAWSDCNGDIEKRFTKDELLTNLTVYWATETINSSVRLYYETTHNPPRNPGKRIEAPTAMAMPFKDIARAPREWESRFCNIVRWTDMPKGGHFLEAEEPELVAKDMREFFRDLRVAGDK